MKFVTLNDLLPQAKAGRYAIPQFNINGYLWIEAIIEEAVNQDKSVIIGVTDRNVTKLGGYRFIRDLIHLVYEHYSPSSPLVLHLDHGQSVENCMKAIDAGFSSVMFDGSGLVFEENKSQTREVVKYAEKFNVSVEGELGSIGGVEDGITANILYADPDQCLSFVEETGINALAAALGSVHGEYFDEPNLQFELMKKISSQTDIPLVLHGASGISETDIMQVIGLGHAKINYNTEINIAVAQSLRELLLSDKNLYDPKDMSLTSKHAIKEVVQNKIKLLNN